MYSRRFPEGIGNLEIEQVQVASAEQFLDNTCVNLINANRLGSSRART